MRACLVGMRRVRGLMLRIRRLGRRHAVLVHGRPAIVPRATRAVGHQRVRGRPARARRGARLQYGSRRVAHVVGVPDARRLWRPRGRLLRLLRRRRRGRGTVMCRRRRRGASMLLRRPACVQIGPHLVLLLGAGRSLTGGSWPTKGFAVGGVWIPRLRGRIDIRNPASPRVRPRARSTAVEHGLRRLRGCSGARPSPLRPRRTNGAGGLIGLGMNVGGHRCLPRRGAIGLAVSEQLQPRLDVRI